jgi:putative transposase
MSTNKPRADVRLAIVNWDPSKSGMSVTEFCRFHGVSRAWFYKVRRRTSDEGRSAGMAEKSRRPKSSPNLTDQDLTRAALDARAELREQGWDFGPINVAYRMGEWGLKPPSRATLARIFRRAGVVAPQPQKRPRSSYTRFEYPQPNCCWQIDATDWRLADGTPVAIFQVLDDHSRRALASLVATGETSLGAIDVVEQAIARVGVPQRFLSDNGSALNQNRLGIRTQLVAMLERRGVEAMTGRPGKPTTQGKNERFHQPLHRFLRAHPPAVTMAELQQLCDQFDDYYNYRRHHQGIGGLTPMDKWRRTPVALPPRPRAPPEQAYSSPALTRRVRKDGVFGADGYVVRLGKAWAGATIRVIHDNHTIIVYDRDGTEIRTIDKPTDGRVRISRGVGKGQWNEERLSTKS